MTRNAKKLQLALFVALALSMGGVTRSAQTPQQSDPIPEAKK